MFYSEQILARRGPLGLVWLAAHMHQQLKRSQVARLRLELAVEALLHPETPLALRLSGQLLLGLVRLYSKQIGYLQQDCQEALLQLQLAFHAAMGQPHAAAAHTLPAGAPALPAPGGGAAAPPDPVTAWGAMVDLAEAQLLQLQMQPPVPRSMLLLPDGGNGQRAPAARAGAADERPAGFASAWREALLPLQALPAGPAAALLVRRPAQSTASRLLGSDADTAGQHPAPRLTRRGSLLKQQLADKQQQASGAAAGAEEEEDQENDVRLARDQFQQRERSRGTPGPAGLTPGKPWPPASRASSGGESLFAAVASSVIASASQLEQQPPQGGGLRAGRRAPRAGSVSVGGGGGAGGGAQGPLLPAPLLLLPNDNAPLHLGEEEDEVFAPGAGAAGAEMLDLLGLPPGGEIELEVARDAGPSGARLQPRSAAHLLAPLQAALGDGGEGGAGGWGGATPSTGRASKRASEGGAREEWAGPGSQQGSRAGLLATLRQPRLGRRGEGEGDGGGGGGRADSAGGGSGLMDMELDLERVVADDLMLGPDLGLALGDGGNVYNDSNGGPPGDVGGAEGDTPAGGAPLSGQGQRPGQGGTQRRSSARLAGGATARGLAPAGPEEQPPPLAEDGAVALEQQGQVEEEEEDVGQQAQGGRRASARLQQQPPPPPAVGLARGVPGPALLPPLPPGAPTPAAARGRAGARGQQRAAGGQVLPAAGGRAAGEGLQLRKFQAAQLMDGGAGAGRGRGAGDGNVIRNFRDTLEDTSSLVVQRGLVALRRQRLAKRLRSDAELAEQVLADGAAAGGGGGGGGGAAAGPLAAAAPGAGHWPMLQAGGWGAEAQQLLDRCIRAPPLPPQQRQAGGGAAAARVLSPTPSLGTPQAAGGGAALPQRGQAAVEAPPEGDAGAPGVIASPSAGALVPPPAPGSAAPSQGAPPSQGAATAAVATPAASGAAPDAPAPVPEPEQEMGQGAMAVDDTEAEVAVEGPDANDENQAPAPLPTPGPAAAAGAHVAGVQLAGRGAPLGTPAGAAAAQGHEAGLTPARSGRAPLEQQQQKPGAGEGHAGAGSARKAPSVEGSGAAAAAEQAAALQQTPLSGGGGWGDGLPGAGSSGRVGGTPAAAALGSSASAQRLGSLSGSQALLLLGRSGSQTTRSQQLPGEGGHLERRAVHTLQAVTRLKASALPPELHTQLEGYATQAEGSQLAWLLQRQRSLSTSLGDSPAASQAARRAGSQAQATQEGGTAAALPLSQQLLASQGLVEGLLGSQAVQLSQLLQDRAAAAGGGGGVAEVKRLSACRCFYDLLVLQQNGLVRLGGPQQPAEGGEAEAEGAERQLVELGAGAAELSVQLTPAGLEACVLGSL